MNKNPMEFRKEKCRVLDLGRNKLKHQCMLGVSQMEISSAEKYLGVLVDIKLNKRHKCALVVKKVNSILGFFSQSIASKTREVIQPLYSALVKLLLNIQFWVPQCMTAMGILERAQYTNTGPQR